MPTVKRQVRLQRFRPACTLNLLLFYAQLTHWSYWGLQVLIKCLHENDTYTDVLVSEMYSQLLDLFLILLSLVSGLTELINLTLRVRNSKPRCYSLSSLLEQLESLHLAVLRTYS